MRLYKQLKPFWKKIHKTLLSYALLDQKKDICMRHIQAMILLLLLSLSTLEAKEEFDYKLQATKVSDNVWCFLGALEGPSQANGGNMVNTCYVKTPKSYVVIDSGPTYLYAKQSYRVMQKIANLPVEAVILTHDHDDHWLGNSFYKEQFNAKLIGPTRLNQEYKAGDQTRMFKLLSPEALAHTKIVKVDETLTKTTELTIGGVAFEIVSVGTKAHTDEDYFVYMPDHKVLFAGDLAMNGRITSNRHGSLLGQLKAIEMMQSKPFETFVAGHGFDTSKSGIEEAKRYFTLLHQRLLKAIDEGVDSSELAEAVPMKEFKDKAMFQALNGQNVAEAFEELEFLEE
jgi:cyclase